MPKTTNTKKDKLSRYVLILFSPDQTNDSEAPEETIFFSSTLSLVEIRSVMSSIFSKGGDIPFKNLPIDSKLYSKEKTVINTLDDYFTKRAYYL